MVSATVLGGLWAWHAAETNLRYVRGSSLLREYSFDARIKMLTEMYCSYQYQPKKVCHAHFDAHKPLTNFNKS